MPRIVRLSNVEQFAAINVTSDPGYDRGNTTIPQCADIILYWVTPSLRGAKNILHGRYAGAFSGSQTQANAILTGLTTGAQWTALRGFLNTGAGISAVGIRDRNADDQPIILSSASGSVGNGTGSPLPDEVAVVGTLRTAFTGPAHRGRMYIPGWDTSALGAGNVVAAAAVTALNNWLTTIAGVLSAQGYTFCIGHMSRLAYTGASGTPHEARAAGTVPVTSIAVRDNHWDSQRRRGLK